MRFHRTPRLLTSWIAVLAILMAALAPSLSQAFGAQNGASWVEVCSAMGSKWVQADGGAADQAPAPGDTASLEKCPYCSLHANTAALPPPPMAWALPPALPALVPAAFLAAPRKHHAWLIAPSRAPPPLS